MERNKNEDLFSVVRFMFEANTKLNMSSLSLSTAVTLFYRFHRDHKDACFDLKTIATTLLYLSGKIEEENIKMRDVINVAHRICNKHLPPLEINETYWQLKETILQTELYLLRALRFQFDVDHPHKYLMQYLKSLYDWMDSLVTSQTAIAHQCWAFLIDSYHHPDLTLHTPPDLLSIAIIHLVFRLYDVTVPCNDSALKPWWKALLDKATLRDIKSVTNKLMDMYSLE